MDRGALIDPQAAGPGSMWSGPVSEAHIWSLSHTQTSDELAHEQMRGSGP